MVLNGERRSMSQVARFQETLRRLAMIDEGFIRDEAGLALAQSRDGMVLNGERRTMSQTARFQETLRRLAMIDEGFIRDEAGLALGSATTSALDPKTARLLQVGASVTVGPSPVCLQWSIAQAMAAGATEDEIADVLLAIAPARL